MVLDSQLHVDINIVVRQQVLTWDIFLSILLFINITKQHIASFFARTFYHFTCFCRPHLPVSTAHLIFMYLTSSIFVNDNYFFSFYKYPVFSCALFYPWNQCVYFQKNTTSCTLQKILSFNYLIFSHNIEDAFIIMLSLLASSVSIMHIFFLSMTCQIH